MDIKNVIQSIKQNINAVDLISEKVMLKKSGSCWVGMCPFHDNKNTPAFVVWQDGHWKCFGECDAHGDVIDFYMKVNHTDLLTSLEELSKKAGVKFDRSPDNVEIQKKKAVYYRIMERACQYYQEQLINHPNAGAYLTNRGISQETQHKFRLGYAPPNVADGLVQFLSKSGFCLEDIVNSGAAHNDDANHRICDCFFDRTTFPIQDVSGRVVGFGARTMTNKVPKFINTTNTVIFEKASSLYGINHAISSIRKTGEVVIVEGYIDAVMLQQSGFENSVAVMGTALSEKHTKFLGDVTLILALDSDKAGQQAILKNIIRVGNQKRIGIAVLPEGKDPDEIVLEDKTIWSEIVLKAEPAARFAINTVLAKIDIENHLDKSGAAKILLPLIGDITDPIVRDGYIQELAKKLQVNASVLSNSARKPIPEDLPGDTHEDVILGTLSKYPHAVWLVDRKLRERGLAPFNENDFPDTVLKAVARLVRESVEQVDYDADEYIKINIANVITEESVLEKLANANCSKSEDEATKLLYNIVVRMRIKQLDSEIQKIAFMDGEDIAGVLSVSLEKKRLLNRALEI